MCEEAGCAEDLGGSAAGNPRADRPCCGRPRVGLEQFEPCLRPDHLRKMIGPLHFTSSLPFPSPRLRLPVNPLSDTTATLLTPIGRSAVAVIEVRGPQAPTLIDHHFKGSSPSSASCWPLQVIRYGRWQAHDYQEDLVVTRLAELHFEIHSHGGLAAPQAILHHLRSSGCRILNLDEAAQRVYGQGTQAAAAIAASQASTARIAVLLQWQIDGALQQALESLIQALEDSGAETSRLDRQHTDLLETYRYGRWTETPASVVIAGPPNAGKSSLVNALLGFTRSLVFDRPGTTRDVVESTTVIDGWPVTLTDTAGQRSSTQDPLEQQGIERGFRAIQAADLVIALRPATDLVSSSSSPTPLDELLANDSSKCIPAWSKLDCVPESVIPPDQIATSVITGAGISTLMSAIAQRLGVRFTNAPHPVLFSQQQFQLVSQARHSLRAGLRAEAASELRKLI